MDFDIPNIEWASLKACIIVRQNNICAMCKKELKDQEFTLHHIIPRVKGGETELYNLIGLCEECHNIAELEELNRGEIMNYRRKYSLNDYNENVKPIRKSYFMPETNEQTGYRYPEKIILQEKYIIKKSLTKHILKYGFNLREMAKIFRVSITTICRWLNNPIKEKRIISILNNLK